MKATRIHEHLYFDDISGCGNDGAFSYVHACKDPCHRKAEKYEKSLPSTHPHYLAYEEPQHLYLNLVDSPVP